MAIIINIKNKKQERVVKEFLNELDIEFQSFVEEDAATYKTTPKRPFNRKEKKILNNLDMRLIL